MRESVRCLNCGIKWVRITAQFDGTTIELTDNLMYNCPNCNSNYYESVLDESLIEEE